MNSSGVITGSSGLRPGISTLISPREVPLNTYFACGVSPCPSGLSWAEAIPAESPKAAPPASNAAREKARKLVIP